MIAGHRSRPGVFVAAILADSVAALDGRLQRGDAIVAVNGHSLEGLRLREAARVIDRWGG